MRNDIVDLRDFYASGLGRVAARVIRRHMRTFWPDLHGLSVLGVGYPTPFLRPFVGEAVRVAAVMPASQGVLPWPAGEPNRVALADEAELPFPDLSIDRILLVHAVETSETLRPMMREVWRVLAGNGRLLVIVPNRRGVWARLDRTPFGYGRPYSPNQLGRLLRDTMFTPIRSRLGLYVPPLRSRMLAGSSEAWEEIGGRWFTRFGGVVMTEAAKEIYAATPVADRGRRRYLVPSPARPPRTAAGRAGGVGRTGGAGGAWCREPGDAGQTVPPRDSSGANTP